jgi:hypothetical protein
MKWRPLAASSFSAVLGDVAGGGGLAECLMVVGSISGCVDSGGYGNGQSLAGRPPSLLTS